MNSTPLRTEALSEAITIGSMLLQNQPQLVFFAAILLVWMTWMTYAVTGTRASTQIGRVLQSLQTLEGKIDMMSLPGPTVSSPSVDSGTFSRFEQTTQTAFDCLDAKLLQVQKEFAALQCVDAKLLQIQKEFGEIKHFILELQMEEVFPKLSEAVGEAVAHSKATAQMMEEWKKEVPPKLREVYGFASTLPALNKLVQSMGIDTQKSFALHETLLDGLLKQGRDSLHHIQSEERAQSDMIKEIKSDLKQVSLDIHVSNTKLEQKADSIQKDLASLTGCFQSTLRGFNPLIPLSKTLKDTLDNVVDYCVKANQHDHAMASQGHATQESAANAEDHGVRLEALVGGIQQTLTEVAELCQQTNEFHNLIHEQVAQILERTPKLPKRSPPQTEAPPPTTTSPPPMAQQPAQPPQPMPMPHPCAHGGPLDAGHPIRIADHLQPLVRGGQSQNPIYMVQDPLGRFSTHELLSALLGRSNLS
ncbi:unnamed protein product [Symbiodinium sp. CCMP2592]|nr:unnamed protein product [Symbiodinium sp. CCMP2592]